MTTIKYLKSRGWSHIRTNIIGNRKQFVWQHPFYGDREFIGTDFALYASNKITPIF